MAKNTKGGNQVLSYRHSDRRKNNPEVGMVSPDTDPEQPKTTYSYDPHIDPTLQFDSSRSKIEKIIDDALISDDKVLMQQALEQIKRQQTPYLNWAGKAEKTNFDVDTISLHVHERIDPASILSSVRKGIKKEKSKKIQPESLQLGLFSAPFENLPLRDAVDFYKHDRGWANRLIAGDSLLVMNSLIQKESMAGQVQMIFFDPPYGIKYGSNFQPFVNKKEVKDGKDEDLTQEPEMLKAFRDTWTLGIHSYLTYIRDRLMLSRDLLKESGSIFLQISDENLHHIRSLMDEVFGAENFVALIPFRKKTMPLGAKHLEQMYDFLVWYAKDISRLTYNPLFVEYNVEGNIDYNWYQTQNGSSFQMNDQEFADAKNLPKGAKVFLKKSLKASGTNDSGQFTYSFQGKEYPAVANGYGTTEQGMKALDLANRLIVKGNQLTYKYFANDYPITQLLAIWTDTVGAKNKSYVVQTSELVLQRCMLMTTNPGDLVFDPTCGGGTTAYVAEKWGRRWITCDTSRIALTLSKQRLTTASFDYYSLRYPHEGLKGGFEYKTAPHISLNSIANNQELSIKILELKKDFVEPLRTLNQALRPEKNLEAWEVPPALPIDWKDPQVIEAFNIFDLIRIKITEAIDQLVASYADNEILFDQPEIDRSKSRISGPFTFEAVPSPIVKSLEDVEHSQEADNTIGRSGQSQRHHAWKDELIKTGIRGKNNQILKLTDLETLPEVKYLHASGTTIETGERVVISFGPEYSLLEQRQVEMAMREASELFPRPKIILFCAFDFDPEAAKDIDCTKGVVALKVKMNADLLTDDLKKQKSSNQSFWFMGQPDVQCKKNKDGLWQVEVYGFDYFDTTKGELISGGKSNIASWALDTDYDGRSVFPRQVFFPMSGVKDGWSRLAKDLKGDLDEDALEKFKGTVSLPFEAGDFKKVAIKIVDDRGIESLKVLDLED